MKIKLALKVLIPLIFISCTQTREIGVYLEYDNIKRELNVGLISSAQYLTKLDTIIKHDTLALFIYEKPIFLTFKESNKKASRIITIDNSIHFIQHGDSVYSLEKLPHPR